MLSYLAGRDSGSRAAFLHVLLTHARATRVSTPSTCERMSRLELRGSRHRNLSLRRASLTSPINAVARKCGTATRSAFEGAFVGLDLQNSAVGRRELSLEICKDDVQDPDEISCDTVVTRTTSQCPTSQMTSIITHTSLRVSQLVAVAVRHSKPELSERLLAAAELPAVRRRQRARGVARRLPGHDVSLVARGLTRRPARE